MKKTIINFNLIGLTKYDILNKISELDIYNKYSNVGTLSVGKLNTSPLRTFSENDDKTPSFHLYYHNNQLKFKDFGGDQLSGNCFDYVKYIFNINYEEVLKKIYLDFELHKVLPNNNNLNETKSLDYLKNINKQIITVPRNFNIIDYNYFKQYYLPLDFVKSKKVYACSYVYISKNDYEITLWAKHSNEQPIYAWEVNGKIKCYRPNSDRKNYKWISSMGLDHLQNIETLNTNSDILFITKSMKDCLVLEYLGYGAIAPGSEGSEIPEYYLEQLKKQFKKIFIFYDNDETGLKAASKLSEKTKYKYIYIPDTRYKDISDYIKEFGIDTTSLLIKKLINE